MCCGPGGAQLLGLRQLWFGIFTCWSWLPLREQLLIFGDLSHIPFQARHAHHPQAYHQSIPGAVSWFLAPLDALLWVCANLEGPLLRVGCQSCVPSSRNCVVLSSEKRALMHSAHQACLTLPEPMQSRVQLWVMDQAFQCFLYGLLQRWVVLLYPLLFGSLAIHALFVSPEYGIYLNLYLISFYLFSKYFNLILTLRDFCCLLNY